MSKAALSFATSFIETLGVFSEIVIGSTNVTSENFSKKSGDVPGPPRGFLFFLAFFFFFLFLFLFFTFFFHFLFLNSFF